MLPRTLQRGGVLDVADGGGVHDVAHDEALHRLVLGHLRACSGSRSCNTAAGHAGPWWHGTLAKSAGLRHRQLLLASMQPGRLCSAATRMQSWQMGWKRAGQAHQDAGRLAARLAAHALDAAAGVCGFVAPVAATLLRHAGPLLSRRGPSLSWAVGSNCNGRTWCCRSMTCWGSPASCSWSL